MPSEIYTLNVEIINNALQISQDQVNESNTAANYAIQASNGMTWFNNSYSNWHPDATEPAVYIPQTIEEADPFYRYETEKQALIAYLSQLFADYFETYYPLDSDAFDEAMAWLQNTIVNGGTGIPAEVENQIWQRYRDSIVRSGLQAQNSAYADFAARGFPLPPGALAARLDGIRTENMTKIAESARDIAIKQIEVEIENIKFAVKTAIDARLEALKAAADYLRAMALAPDIATKIAQQNSDAQARLISAAADFYRARLTRDDLAYKAWATLMEQRGKDAGVNMQSWGHSIDARTRAAVGAADVYGRNASAALSSLTSIVGVNTQAFESGGA
jgi:hypothetical protein